MGQVKFKHLLGDRRSPRPFLPLTWGSCAPRLRSRSSARSIRSDTQGYVIGGDEEKTFSYCGPCRIVSALDRFFDTNLHATIDLLCPRRIIDRACAHTCAASYARPRSDFDCVLVSKNGLTALTLFTWSRAEGGSF